MSIRYTPNKGFSDPGERVLDQALDQLARGSAIVEPESVGALELDLATVVPLVQAVPVAPAFTATKLGAETVNAASVLELSDSFAAPARATIDSIVDVAQRRSELLFSGYVEIATDIFGNPNPVVKLVALNHTNANATISDGEPIFYSVAVDTSIEQPRSPNAALTVTPGIEWIDPITGESNKLPLSVGNLNKTAKPSVTLPDASIGPIELKSSFIAALAALNAGKRAVFTNPTDATIPANSNAVVLGVVSFIGATGPRVRVGQIGSGPLFTGYISSTNGVTIVTIQARNNAGFFSQKVPAGTKLNVLVY